MRGIISDHPKRQCRRFRSGQGLVDLAIGVGLPRVVWVDFGRLHRTLCALTPARPRGQSLVEFALVLPMLLVLLLGIADFGRVFTAGIILEAAARNGAETAAQEYLQLRRSSTPLATADYGRIHQVALQTVCEEAERLPNQAVSGSSCTMPSAAVCIHDFAAELPGYGSCGAERGAAPSQCTDIHASWPGEEPAPGMLAYVEVRTCYQFTTLLNLTDLYLPFGWRLSLGDIWLQRDRTFTVADY